MERLIEDQGNKINKKIRTSRWIRAGVALATVTTVGGMIKPEFSPDYPPYLRFPLSALAGTVFLVGVGGFGALKINEINLRSSNKKMANEIARQSAIAKTLEENGIIINASVLSDSSSNFPVYENWVKKHPFFPNEEPFTFSPEDKVSKDGATYKYFLSPYEGRDWGCILRKTDEKVEIMAEDYIGNLTEDLSQLAQKVGIDLKSKGINLRNNSNT